MTSAETIPAVVLKRKAVVYVRQSTQSQVMTNLESKRRQYDLVDVATNGASSILKSSMMISAARQVERWHGPDSTRLVAWLCAGKGRRRSLAMPPGLLATVVIGILA